jgi:hypothetical protein
MKNRVVCILMYFKLGTFGLAVATMSHLILWRSTRESQIIGVGENDGVWKCQSNLRCSDPFMLDSIPVFHPCGRRS